MSMDTILLKKDCVVSNLIGFLKVFSTATEKHGDSQLIFSDVPYPVHNICIVPEAATLSSTAIDKIITQYRDSGIECFCVFQQADTSNIDAVLIEKHFNKGSSFAGMLKKLDQTTHAIDLPLDMQIVNVTTEQQIKDFLQPFQAAFGHSDAACAVIAKYFKREINNPDIKHYVAYDKEKAVGCGSVFIQNKDAGLYNLGVLPEYRNKGIGLQLQKTRLNFAKSQHCQQALMQAAAISEIMAAKLGFEKVTYFTPYFFNFIK